MEDPNEVEPTYRLTGDALVRTVVAMIAAAVGAAGVVAFPSGNYLWLPSMVLLLMSLAVLVWYLGRDIYRWRRRSRGAVLDDDAAEGQHPKPPDA